MIKLISKTFCNYYGQNPDEYYIKFIHHNIDIIDEDDAEYKKIEEDLKNIYEFDNKAFVLYFSDVDNLLKLDQHLNIGTSYKDKIYLRIRKKEEYEKLIKYNKLNNIKIILDLKDVEDFNIKDMRLVIQIDTVKELPQEKLKHLLEKYNIKEILLGQIPYLSKEYEYLYDVMAKMYGIDANQKLELEKINKITNDIYSVSDYKKILNALNNTIEDLNIQNKIDGIYKIFDYIAKNVSYDDDGVKNTKIENQNLIGPIFRQKAVCEGYSKFLQQILSLIDVESIVVQRGGAKEDDGHVWNQVLVDNKWYNVDVTAASYGLMHNEKVNTCLVKDEAIIYKTNTSVSFICDKNYKE